MSELISYLWSDRLNAVYDIRGINTRDLLD